MKSGVDHARDAVERARAALLSLATEPVVVPPMPAIAPCRMGEPWEAYTQRRDAAAAVHESMRRAVTAEHAARVRAARAALESAEHELAAFI